MNHVCGHTATASNTRVQHQQQRQHTATVTSGKLQSARRPACALSVSTSRCQRSHAGGIAAVGVLCHPAAAAPDHLRFATASSEQPDQDISQPLASSPQQQPEHPAPGQLQQGIAHHARTWRPKWQLDRVASISGVCRMVQQHGQEFGPGMWVKAFVQVVKLVDAGQQVPARAWHQLKHGLLLLTASPAETAAGWYDGDAEQQDAQPAAAAAAAAPIGSFTAWQLCTLMWATAKLGLQVPEPAWPPLLAQAQQVSSSMSPRDTSLTLWALARLKPPVAVGGVVEALLQGNRQPLTNYPPRSLSLLLHSMARLKVWPPPALQQQLVAALEAHLTTTSSSSSFSGRDLCLLLWSLPGLQLTPPASVVTAALRASRHHLAYLDCSFLTALLVGVGRLRFVPPGPWLLELYDQMYWTVDQLSLGQLAGCLWSLGRLQLVAVPPELLERLLVFVGVRLAEVQQQAQQQQTQWKADSGGSISAADASKQSFTVGKQMGLLLSGLLGLSSQLRPEQQQLCSSWLLVLLESPVTPQSAQQVGGALHAAARLRVRLSDPADCDKVWQAVGALQGRLGLLKLAAAVWGAVQVAGQPQQQDQQQQQAQRQHVQQCLVWTQPELASAGVGALLMLMHACVLVGCQPPAAWWAAAQQRLQQLVPQLSSRNCVFLSQLLVALLAQVQQEVCGEQPPVAVATTATAEQQQEQASPSVAPAVADGLAGQQQQCVVSAEGVRVLVLLLAARVEQLEVQQRIAGRSLQNFERNRSLLRQLTG